MPGISPANTTNTYPQIATFAVMLLGKLTKDNFGRLALTNSSRFFRNWLSVGMPSPTVPN